MADRPKVLTSGFDLVPIDRLDLHPENINEGDQSRLAESIGANGFYGAVIAQESTGRVLVGNHRLLYAREHHLPALPVLWVDVDDEVALRILVGDNRHTRLGRDSDPDLLALLQELAATPEGLAGTGFNEYDLAELAFEPGEDDAAGGSRTTDDDGTVRCPFCDHIFDPDAADLTPAGTDGDGVAG